MDQYFLLNSRKRAIIALIHTVVFLGIAVPGLFGASRPPLSLHSTGGMMLYGIYGIVTSILLWLFLAARCVRERLYFGFCATSAGLSIVRGMLGETSHHPIQAVKVFMLISGGLAAISIYRAHPASVLRRSTAELAAEPE